MINADEEDLIYFSSIDELNDAGYTCIGILYELRDCDYSGRILEYFSVDFRVKSDTSLIGNTYAMTTSVRGWNQDISFSWLTDDEEDYPTSYVAEKPSTYTKTEYDENGEIISGTHSPSYRNGNSLLVTNGSLTLEKTAIDEDGEEKTKYDFSKNEYTVTYSLDIGIDTVTSVDNIILRIEDTLPEGLTYVGGSTSISVATAEVSEPEITENDDGTTTLLWYLYNISSDDSPTLQYNCSISSSVSNNSHLTNDVILAEVAQEDIDGNVSFCIANSDIDNRESSYTINIVNLQSYSIYQTTDTPIIERNGDVHYNIIITNHTSSALDNFQFLDILPYVGDENGTNFDGTYEVDYVTLTEIDLSTEEELESNLVLYVTSDESVRTDVTANDTNLGTTDIWEEKESSESINDSLTALCLIGSLDGNSQFSIDIYINTSENNPENTYINLASCEFNSSDILETLEVSSTVVKRTLSGTVWYDENNNGIIDDTEEYIENAKISLTNANGETVYNIYGEEITYVTSDENGYYSFDNLAKEDYIATISLDDVTLYITDNLILSGSNLGITDKEIGSNILINSKFDESSLSTDTITTLNSIASPVLSSSYVNAGVIIKEINLEITNVGTTTSTLLEGVTFNLYKQVCTDDHSSDLIGTADYDTDCWELVGTYTSDSEGIISLSSLAITGVYRLVEISTIDGYVLPDGEWQIEFDYGELSEDEIVYYNEQGIKITSVSNPPAISLIDDTLYLYNMEGYDLPLSGSSMQNLIYYSIIAFIIALIAFILRKKSMKKSHLSKHKISSLRKSILDARNIAENYKN